MLIIYNSYFGHLKLHYHCCQPPSYAEHLACWVPRCRSCPVLPNDMQSSTLIIHVWVYKWHCYAEMNQSSCGNAVGRKWKFNSRPRLVFLIPKQAHYFASTNVFFLFIVTGNETGVLAKDLTHYVLSEDPPWWGGRFASMSSQPIRLWHQTQHNIVNVAC